jgi:hypothetical protein
VQIAIILNCAGSQIINIYDQFIWDEEGGEKKPDKLFEKLEGYYVNCDGCLLAGDFR